MRQHYRHFLLLAVLAGLGQAAPAQQGEAKVLGRILVMENDRCLEGDVEAVEERYCVRNGPSEIWVVATKVVRVCADWPAAYEFMKTRFHMADPDERLLLARWCQQNNLLESALAEAKIAQEMRPDHAPTRHLVDILRQNIATSKAPAPAPAASEVYKAGPALDLNADATALFATRIQPILTNGCASCHTTGRGGAFQLGRSSEGGQRTALQRNVQAVLAQVNFDRPELSPLLIKAVSGHGPVPTPPLSSKKAVPYQILERWVLDVVAGNPHLRERFGFTSPPPVQSDTFATAAPPKTQPAAPPAAVQKPVPPLVPKVPTTKKTENIVPPLPGGAVVSAGNETQETSTPGPSAPPPAALREGDPFDPAAFNQQVRPQR